MKSLKSIAAGLIATVLAAPAFAADPVIAPVVLVAPAPLVIADPGFDWNGPYAGATVAAVFQTTGFDWAIPAVRVGYNMARGRFFVGAVADIGWAWGPGVSGMAVAATVRAGLATDRALIYGLFGFQAYPYPLPVLPFYAMAGVGAEFALGDRLSVFGEFRLEEVFSPPFYFHVAGGVNFHFGH